MVDRSLNGKVGEQLNLLSDRDPRVRLTAIGALARLGD